MRVGFFHTGPITQYAAMMVASVKRAMPGIQVMQFGHHERDRVVGADMFVEVSAEPLALAVLRAYACLSGEWLFLDTDVVVQRDVRIVFEQPFDIAVATREGTLRPSEVGTKFMARMPFNKGAVFSRSQAFWADACWRLEDMPTKRQAWMGDQLAMNAVIADGGRHGHRYRVAVLPAEYNYPPCDAQEDLRDKQIVHFKGPRKAWMLRRAA